MRNIPNSKLSFEKKQSVAEKIGMYFGYGMMFTVFSIVLFLVLRKAHRLPEGGNIIDTAIVAAVIQVVGLFIKEAFSE